MADTWKKWKRNVQFYIDAVLSGKTEKEKYSMFLLTIGEGGRDIFSTWSWPKKKNTDGTETDEDDITVNGLFTKFENHCIPKKNIIVERINFFRRNQFTGEPFETFLTDLRKLSSTCDFGTMNEGMVLYKLADGLECDRLREKVISKGSDINLEKAIELCRADELTKSRKKCSINSEFTNIEQISKNNTNTFTREISKGSKNRSTWKKCNFCGFTHDARKCPAYGKRCNRCNRMNHFQRCCTLKQIREVNRDQDETYQLEFSEQNAEYTYVIEPIGACKSISQNEGKNKKEALVIITLNDTKVRAKLDTGAEVNVMPNRIFRKLKKKAVLEQTPVNLKSYGGHDIPTRGQCTLDCKSGDKSKILDFYVVETESRTIIGLESCEQLGLVKILNEVNKDPVLENVEHKIKQIQGKRGDDLKTAVLRMYPDVFEGLGRINPPHKMRLKDGYEPVVHPPRKIPETIRTKLKNELERMEKDDVIAKVDEPTEWVSSLVIVEKPDGSLRICMDPKQLNKNLKREHYQLPTFEEISMRLSDATIFTKLDANKGYWRIPLDYKSSLLTTVNTPFGRYRFKRLPFGVHSAQEVFHKKIQQIFGDMSNVETDIDDFLIWGSDEGTHNTRLIQCLERMRENNITLNIKKCSFGVPEVKYLGHKMNKNGVFPDVEKVKAIKEMPIPTCKKDIQRFLGLVNYVGRFLSNLSEITAPMRKLLKKSVDFLWEEQQQKSFETVKSLIISEKCLSFYDVYKDVCIEVDACKTGLGAVLMQEDKPVAYASRSMTPAQLNYAIIEKELQAIVFACERFHQYIYGKHVIVYSDHKPLENITAKNLANAPPRLQRMLLRLQKYEIEVVYRPGKEMIIPDTLSRAHLNEAAEEIPEDEIKSQIHMMYTKCLALNDMETIKDETNKDETSIEIKNYTLNGWPERKQVSKEANRYYAYRGDLSVINDIVLKGERVVIPRSIRKQVIETLHSSHLGIEKSKLRARNSVFWPGINKQIEDVCNSCTACIATQRNLQKEPLLNTKIPKYPMQMVGTDLFDWEGLHFVVMVDYHSRYWEIERLRNLKSVTVINKLKGIFARNGIPEILRSDNGSQYTSYIFKHFTNNWGIEHITSSPEYPKSNGLAEKTVQIAKNMLTRCRIGNSDPFLALLEIRNTPVDEYLSPNELLKGRICRSTMPVKCSKYNVSKTYNQSDFEQVRSKCKAKQKHYYDKSSKELKELENEETVYLKEGKYWKRAKVAEKLNQPRSYILQKDNRNKVRRNRRDILTKNEYENKNISDLSDDSADESIVEASNDDNGCNENVPRDHASESYNTVQSRYGRTSRKPDVLHYRKLGGE